MRNSVRASRLSKIAILPPRNGPMEWEAPELRETRRPRYADLESFRVTTEIPGCVIKLKQWEWQIGMHCRRSRSSENTQGERRQGPEVFRFLSSTKTYQRYEIRRLD